MKPILAILNIFIDPAESVRNMEGRFAWVWPFLLVSIVGIGVSFVISPAMMQLMRNNPPANMPPEAIEKMMSYSGMMQKASVITTPLTMGIVFAITALLLFAACSVLDVKAKFMQVFTLVCHSGLILSLAQIAGAIVIHLKGELQSLKELQPSFGPDMFLPEDTSGVLIGFFKCFDLFHLWYYVVLVAGISAMFKITKGKALGVALPILFLTFIFTMASSILSNR
jgi:uncharacterized protein YneF (UPF0154 family)